MRSITPADLDRGRIMVVGDVMLDRYIWGNVRRICPEAPVPVVHISRESQTLGGAGNVAANLKALGCQVQLAGIIGNDPAGADIARLVGENDIQPDLVAGDRRPTTTKTRIIAKGQQLLRLDDEQTVPVSADLEKSLLGKIGPEMANVDVIVLSDYNKGVLTEKLCQQIIHIAGNQQTPVLVDPKGENWERYCGATGITPNLAELQLAVSLPFSFPKTDNDPEIEKRARQVIGQLDIDHLVVTRGAEGLSVYRAGKAPLHFSAQAREVYDVSGAGDTVMAVLAAARACGAGLSDAARWANLAGGIAVAKVGTQPVTRAELLAAWQGQDKPCVGNKIKTLPAVLTRVEQWRQQGRKVVFTNGCFDILHCGHVRLLESAARLGDRLIVGLNTDLSVRRLKGAARPVNAEDARARLLAALAAVDLVVLFSEDTPFELIGQIRPDVLVKGSDYAGKEVVGADLLPAWGGRLELVPLTEGFSTSNLIPKI